MKRLPRGRAVLLSTICLLGLLDVALVATPYAAADEVTINPFAACGGAVTCNGGVAFSLTTTSLNSAHLPSFGGTPMQFLIVNNTGSTIDTLTFTLSGTLGTSSELWNSNTSGWNPSTNPFTLATIDGFNAPTGTPCTGGGVTLGAPLGGGDCNGGPLSATFVWSVGSGHGIAPGQSFLFEYNSPTAGNEFSSITPVPEPTTLALFGSGLVGMVGVVKRARKSRAS